MGLSVERVPFQGDVMVWRLFEARTHVRVRFRCTARVSVSQYLQEIVVLERLCNPEAFHAVVWHTVRVAHIRVGAVTILCLAVSGWGQNRGTKTHRQWVLCCAAVALSVCAHFSMLWNISHPLYMESCGNTNTAVVGECLLPSRGCLFVKVCLYHSR